MNGWVIEMKWFRGAFLCAAILLNMGVSIAQDELIMQGIEQIDPNERISGDAVVGVNFINGEIEFDPNDVLVYFDVMPVGPITTKLTTVDGRYLFSATSKEKPVVPETKIGHLVLEKKDPENPENAIPLDAAFLTENYNKNSEDREIALLVKDEENRIFPARWGYPKEKQWDPEETTLVRIRVNAEGADAYFIRFDENDKGKLVPCDKASQSSQFKYDHNCDMRWQDMKEIANEGTLQIIRKRGATFETSIPVNIAIACPDGYTDQGYENCVREKQ